MILSRPVKPRASRTHDIVASVPLFTIRTFSIDGTQPQISSAISTSSGFGMPKLTPRAAVVADRIEHDARRVTENRRAPGADVVDVFVAIDVPDLGALGAIDEKRLAPETAKGAHGRVDATGNATAALARRVRRSETSCRTERRTFNVQRVNVQRLNAIDAATLTAVR